MKVTTALCALILSCAALTAADNKKPAAAVPSAIPAGAEQVDQYTWRHKDKAGKTWLYRKSPFGIMRTEEDPEMAKMAASTTVQPEVAFVAEEGDLLRFQVQGPFGMNRYTKKKTQLTAAEKSAWEQKTAGTQSENK